MNSKPLVVFPFLGLILLAMLGVWFFVSGCGKDPEIPEPPPPKTAELQYKTWEKPAAALVLSGEQHGYIEPCGCSETQSGGLARRADLIHGLMKSGWPVAGLDLGGSLRVAKTEAGAELRGNQLVNKLQSILKLNTQFKVMEDLRYSAMALGFEEILLDDSGLLSNYQPRLKPPQGQNIHPVLMDANFLIYGAESGLGPTRTQTLSVGDVKVGITAIVGMSVRRKLFGENPFDPDDFPPLDILPPADVLPQMIKDLKAEKTDFNVLLSHATFEETKELLEKFPHFAVALCMSNGDEGRKEPQTVGGTLVLQVGWKGKHVGLLAYYPDDPDQKFRYEQVELDNKSFQNDPSVEPHLLAYQKALEERTLDLFDQDNGTMTSGFHPKGGEFVGAASCGECHKKAYKKWKASKHAHAYETLKTGRKGQYSQPISRLYDPECLCCHTTGWNPQGVFPYHSGFLPKEVAEHRNNSDAFNLLQGQQCENCHGPGKSHVELEWANRKNSGMTEQENLLAGRRAMKLTKEAAKETLCRKCHDLENSPKFEFDKYWAEIVHPWRD